MDEKQLIEHALSLYGNGYNCAQAVAIPFCDVCGCDETFLFKALEAFGGGMGGTEGTCGALSGALMILSMLSSEGDPKNPSKKRTYERAKNIFDAFRCTTGSVICKDIQGLETHKELCSCQKCVEVAVRTLVQELAHSTY